MSLDKIYKQLFSTVELKSEVIELGVNQEINDLSGTYYKVTGDFDTKLKSVYSLINELTSMYTNIDKTVKELIQKRKVAENLAKNLGIEISDMQSIKDVDKAEVDFKQYSEVVKSLKAIR